MGPQALVYEKVHKKLKEMKLIKESTDVCGNSTYQLCSICYASGSCTKRDPLSGELVHTYGQPDFPVLGGTIMNNKRVPFKHWYCLVQDFCDTAEVTYEPEMYYQAATMAELCRVPGKATEEEFMTVEDVKWDEERCSQAKSQVRICPKPLLKDKNEYIHSVNKELRRLRYKLRISKDAKEKKKSFKKKRRKTRKNQRSEKRKKRRRKRRRKKRKKGRSRRKRRKKQG